MLSDATLLRKVGNDPPILADGHRAPDRREISLRWLAGTFLTGITSSALMGVALFAALDGRQQLAIPAEAYAVTDLAGLKGRDSDQAKRGSRLIGPHIAAKPSDRNILEVPTIVRVGEKDVVKRQPFAHVKMTLAANYAAPEDYPPFDPLNIFSSDESTIAAAPTAAIYGSDVESEVSLQTTDFPVEGAPLPFAGSMSLDEVEENVRSNGSILTDGASQYAALSYVDPQRFANEDDNIAINSALSAKIIEENMNVSEQEALTPMTPEYADDIIPVRRAQGIAAVMLGAGYPKTESDDVQRIFAPRIGSSELEVGDVMRIGVIQRGEEARIVRISIYRGTTHLTTMAVDDNGRLVAGTEPPMLDAVASAFADGGPAQATGRDLPKIYDGIYRAALSYGMSREMTALVIRLLASNVDFQAQLRPTDAMEAFFSVADGTGRARPDSELLYVRARFGDTTTSFYRFQNPDDNSIDYYDQDGKSVRQFLLRNPVPNAKLSSGFGMRRHPILGFSRMHTGTDWAAPRGSPIIATGDGVVEKSGWSSGYGNQTIIRHANGYESSYNHQSAIAKGVREGARIKQGQVIGFVGSTGESTGSHLHYELIVNGTKVDAMKVRLPGGKALEGESLAKFETERQRIDALLGKTDQVATR